MENSQLKMYIYISIDIYRYIYTHIYEKPPQSCFKNVLPFFFRMHFAGAANGASCASVAWLQPRLSPPEPAPGCHLVDAQWEGRMQTGETQLPCPTPAADPLKPFANISANLKYIFPPSSQTATGSVPDSHFPPSAWKLSFPM